MRNSLLAHIYIIGWLGALHLPQLPVASCYPTPHVAIAFAPIKRRFPIYSSAKKESVSFITCASAPRTFATSGIDFVFLGFYQRRRRLKPSEASSEVTSLGRGRNVRSMSKWMDRRVLYLHE